MSDDAIVLLALALMLAMLALVQSGRLASTRRRLARAEAQLFAMRGPAPAVPAVVPVEEKNGLEQRMRVLERIVTDRGYDVATQIEALRDERRLEEATGEARAVQ